MNYGSLPLGRIRKPKSFRQAIRTFAAHHTVASAFLTHPRVALFIEHFPLRQNLSRELSFSRVLQSHTAA